MHNLPRFTSSKPETTKRMSSGKSLTTTNMEPAFSSGTAGKATSNSSLEHLARYRRGLQYHGCQIQIHVDVWSGRPAPCREARAGSRRCRVIVLSVNGCVQQHERQQLFQDASL